MDGNNMMNVNGENDVKKRSSEKNFLAPLIISLGIMISCAILAGAFVKYKTADSRMITATGSASTDFEADLIVWRGEFTAYSENSARAYKQLSNQAELVEDF